MFSPDRNYERNPSSIHLLDESIVQKQRADLLVNAIDKYLSWRQDKNRSDGRKFETTAFTWLRHYSDFGENRARTLKEKLLQQGQDASAMELLQSHFQTQSTVNNHSLDTYILETILKHRCLFLIDESFRDLNTKEERLALQQSVLEQTIRSEFETAFAIGQSCENFSSLNNHSDEIEQLNIDEIAEMAYDCLTDFDEPSDHKNQRKNLIKAVDDYLHWRDNKNQADARGFPPTALTWMRHATAFGENRANTLKQALSNTDYKPVHILQAHFASHSTLNNHSLDTYLLEIIFKNKRLFDISNSFNTLSSEKKRARLRDWIMQYKTSASGNNINNFMEQACLFYGYAAELGQPLALQALNRLAEAGHCSAQLTLGLHYRQENHFSKGTKWIIKAAEQDYQKAKDALYQTAGTSKQFLWLARKYEKGEGVKPDYEMATCFYFKATALDNNDVHQILGHMYETKLTSNSEESFEKDANRAFGYYLVAAKSEDLAALQAMERMAEGHNNQHFSFQTAIVHLEIHANLDAALNWFKKAATIHFKDTVNELMTTAPSKPLYYFILGKLFEEKDVQKSFEYYGKAAEQKNKAALKAMENLAEGRDDLRMNLAEAWLRFFPEPEKALRCFKELADKRLSDAQEKLTALAQDNPDYAVLIAQLYEKANTNESAFFYYLLGMKAARGDVLHQIKQHIESLLNKMPADEEKWIVTGELFLKGSENIKQNYNAAKTCFGLAATQKGNAEAHFYLGLIYQNNGASQKNLVKAVSHLALASEKGQMEAETVVTDLLASERLQPDSLLRLGLIFENGQDGLAKNRELARLFYQKAMSFKYASAALHLGRLYQAEQNSAHAFEAFVLAAQLQNSEALAPLEQMAEEASSENQLALGNIYAQFFHNQPKARYWQERARETEQFDFKL